MPFSMLGQSSKLTTANVLRPYSAKRLDTNISAHGLHSRSTSTGAYDATQRLNLEKQKMVQASQPAKTTGKRHYSAYSSVSTRSFSNRATLVRSSARTSPSPGATYISTRGRSTIAELFRGNEEYMASMSKDNPGLLASLAMEGQRPPFMLVDCSDSRVNEQGIFSAQPGTIFTAGNIANRFDETDLNSNAVLSFAVETLKVKHVVVLGHYGCGGVAASMIPLDGEPSRPADIAVQGWISPIRHIYQTSTRPEIVAHREKYKSESLTTLPHLHDPAFRALVEENVKSNVLKIANSAVVRDLFATAAKAINTNCISDSSSTDTPASSKSTLSPTTSSSGVSCPEIYIHGWVYDVENGKVSDLNVSVGPPGHDLPFSPFPIIGAGHSCASHTTK